MSETQFMSDNKNKNNMLQITDNKRMTRQYFAHY